MSLKSDNKSTRNGQVILNDEKKRSSENKRNFKKIIEKKSQKEDAKKEKNQQGGRERCYRELLTSKTSNDFRTQTQQNN